MELVDQDVPGPRRHFPGYGRRQPKVTGTATAGEMPRRTSSRPLSSSKISSQA